MYVYQYARTYIIITRLPVCVYNIIINNNNNNSNLISV